MWFMFYFWIWCHRTVELYKITLHIAMGFSLLRTIDVTTVLSGFFSIFYLFVSIKMKFLKWALVINSLQMLRLSAGEWIKTDFFSWQNLSTNRFILYWFGLGLFLFPANFKNSIARQDIQCERETVTFNSNFFEFMLAFLGVDQSECACEDPCPSVGKFVKFYLYRPYVLF